MNQQRPTTSLAPWLPKEPPSRGFIGFLYQLKRLHAWLVKGELVWLRDRDDDAVTVTVAYPLQDEHQNETGEYTAVRFWPLGRQLLLKEDGTVVGDRADFVWHWIPVERKEQLLAFMKNSDTYLNTSRYGR